MQILQILQIYAHFSEESFRFSKSSLIPPQIIGLGPNSQPTSKMCLLTFLLNLLSSHFPHAT